MAWNRFDRPVQDVAGNLRLSVGAPVAVYESGGGIALIKDNIAGTGSKSNPFVSDPVTGRAVFYAQGGRYRVVVNEGLPDQTEWPDILLGSASGVDFETLSGDVIYSGVASGVRQIFSNVVTAGDPGAGAWRVNTLTYASITQLRLDDLANGGASIAAWIDTFDDRATTNGRAIIRIEVLSDPLLWIEFLVTGLVVNSTGYRTITVSPLGQAGWPFTNGVETAMTFRYVGNPGADGRDPGVLMTWETAVTDANPAAGAMRANNASLAAATFLYISKTGRFGAALTTFLNTFDDSSSAGVKGQLVLTDASTNAQSMHNITGAVIDATGYVKVPVTDAGGVTSFTNLNAISLQFTRTGDAGNASVPVPFTTVNRAVRTVGAGTSMKESPVFIDDSGSMSAVANLTISGTISTTDGALIGRYGSPTFTTVIYTLANGGLVRNFANNANILSWTDAGWFTAVQLFEGAQRALTVAGALALTGGFWTTSLSLGTIASGTVTPAMSGRNVQHYNNNGAHTLAPPTSQGSIVLDCTNAAAAGAVTRSGFTKVTGDIMATTNGKKYRHFITVGDAGSHCHTQEMV